MAATRLIPMHMQKGKSVRQCLMERTDYAKNPAKTEDGEYVLHTNVHLKPLIWILHLQKKNMNRSREGKAEARM